jgi:hypothetical protein
MTAAAGYSGTPLPQKLGMKDGQRALFLDLPASLGELARARAFAEAAESDWDGYRALAQGWDFVHGFTASRGVLEDNARPLMDAISRDGTIWISWPKKASKVPTDITEDVIREVVLPVGLVDVKVAAVDAVWSGLKLVIRKELR